MKARYPIILTLLLLSFLLTVYAVWLPTDNFDSYSVGATLEAAAGGSSWTGNWNNAPDVGWTSETAPAGGQGGVAARKTGTSSLATSRQFAGISAGQGSWQMRITNTVTGSPDVGIWLGEAGVAYKMQIAFLASGNIGIYDNGIGDYSSLGAYSVDTWYRIDVDFDDAAQNNLYRARVNGGAWSGYKTVLGGSYTVISLFEMRDSWTGAHTLWVDDIRVLSNVALPAVFKRYYDMLRQ